VSKIVLDASAVLALANGEPGAATVMQARSGAVISAVNHLEVVSTLLRAGRSTEQIQQFLSEVFPLVDPFDLIQAEAAARLHATTRRWDLSYADCACLALGQVRQLPVLTGDRNWLNAGVDVEVKLFR
jgi:PIN domain nuclease of toxin-antitoxin system